MKKYSSLLLLILSLFICLTMISCNKIYTKNGIIYAMGTTIEITISSESKEKNEIAFNEIEKIYTEINNLCDKNNQYQDIINIYDINKSSKKLVINDKLFVLLKESVELMRNTDGYFNPFLGNLSDEYKKVISNKDDSKVTSQKFIDEEINKTNNTFLIFDDETKEVQKIGEGLLDLGAIAKGYATNLVKEYLIANDYKYYLINAGCSSILLGEKYQNENHLFNILISGSDSFSLQRKNTEIATSAISEQQVTVNNNLYHHIVNAKNGKCENYYDTVTVIGENSGYLDAISTALFSILNENVELINVIKELYDLEIYMFKDGKIIYKTEEN